jgi:hypothetical protein
MDFTYQAAVLVCCAIHSVAHDMSSNGVATSVPAPSLFSNVPGDNFRHV